MNVEPPETLVIIESIVYKSKGFAIEEKYEVIYQSQQSYYSLFKSAQVSWKKSQKNKSKGSPKLVEDKKKEINQYL
jgi:transposase